MELQTVTDGYRIRGARDTFARVTVWSSACYRFSATTETAQPAKYIGSMDGYAAGVTAGKRVSLTPQGNKRLRG